MFYIISQVAIRFFTSTPPSPAAPLAEAVNYDPATMQTAAGEVNPWTLDPVNISPVWPLGTKVAVHIYVSQSYGYDMFSPTERNTNSHLPSVTWDNITWGNWNYKREQEFMVDVPKVSISNLLVQW